MASMEGTGVLGAVMICIAVVIVVAVVLLAVYGWRKLSKKQ